MAAESTLSRQELAELKSGLVDQAVASLKSLGGDSLMSGEDSGLINVWEEICVQVRGEESVFWDAYQTVIDDFLRAELEKLSPEERRALWLMTDPGMDWEADSEEGQSPPVWDGDIIELVRGELLSHAADDDSPRVERFLYGLDEEDEEDEEEEEEESANENSAGNGGTLDGPLSTQELGDLFDEVAAEVFAENACKREGFFVGWDVGGWNCDRNANSRDAIVILSPERSIVGRPWRGNLREVINCSGDSSEWIGLLFSLCGADAPAFETFVTLAIDAPLGFSQELVSLVVDGRPVEKVGQSDSNAYLFRSTERYLISRGIRPLSAVKDMIGSQATKGIHVLAKFAHHRERCGVWSDGDRLEVIEAYPSPAKNSARMADLKAPIGSLEHNDLHDALFCALIAWLFQHEPERLVYPPTGTPIEEGWIWLPADAFRLNPEAPIE